MGSNDAGGDVGAVVGIDIIGSDVLMTVLGSLGVDGFDELTISYGLRVGGSDGADGAVVEVGWSVYAYDGVNDGESVG